MPTPTIHLSDIDWLRELEAGSLPPERIKHLKQVAETQALKRALGIRKFGRILATILTVLGFTGCGVMYANGLYDSEAWPYITILLVLSTATAIVFWLVIKPRPFWDTTPLCEYLGGIFRARPPESVIALGMDLAHAFGDERVLVEHLGVDPFLVVQLGSPYYELVRVAWWDANSEPEFGLPSTPV